MEKLYKIRRQGIPIELLGLKPLQEKFWKDLGHLTVESIYGALTVIKDFPDRKNILQKCREVIPSVKLKELDNFEPEEYAMGLLMEGVQTNYDS